MGEYLLRIKNHPIIDFKDQKKIKFYYNDKPLFGYNTDSIASALHANKIKTLSKSLKHKNPRGFFCGIGKCSSCLMRVNDIPNIRTCIAPLKKDIKVETQDKLADLPDHKFTCSPKKKLDIDILIVGGGPAGLSAAIEGAKLDSKILLVDENQRLGGQLIKQTHKFFGSKEEKAGTRGIDIASLLEKEVKKFEKEKKIKLMTNSTVIGYYEGKKDKYKFAVLKRDDNYEGTLFEINAKSAIFACGAMENMLLFPGNDMPGVYGAGAVQTLMNVFGVKPGKKVVMVGAGNVGLIVSYQLLQAGINVDRVVEAAPNIGGYHVHAAKLRRCGVPILTSHSIKEVHGKESVEGVTTVKLDKNWKEISGSKEKIKCDAVCLAVGLTPSTRLLSQVGVKMEYIPEAGGYVAIHDENMETSKNKIFVAGDSSGIEEASTAMIEGKIAGVAASYHLNKNKESKKLLVKYKKELERLRAGPFGEKPRVAKEKIIKLSGG